MASTLVKSVRIRPALWDFIEARAALRGISANAWLVRCVEDAQKRLDDPPKAPE